MNDEFWEEMGNFNRRIKDDDRLASFLTGEMHVVNDSGAFALQVGDTTIKETRCTRAEDFEHVLDILCAINEADLAYAEAMYNEQHDDEEYPDREPYLPDYGPPGSGAVVTEYLGTETGLEDGPW
jgi:hypothetical protein